LEKTLIDAFGHCYRVPVRGFETNTLLFAMKGKMPRFGRLQEIDPESRRADLVPVADYIVGAVMGVQASEDALVLTDDFAPVERLTEETIREESRTVMGE
jgi:hypothetical protein